MHESLRILSEPCSQYGNIQDGFLGLDTREKKEADPCYANNQYHPHLTGSVCDDCGMDFDPPYETIQTDEEELL
jgi:hypothetical protein